jgi:hypothetical protein
MTPPGPEDSAENHKLWLAVIELTMMDPAEETQTYLLAAPDRTEAEYRLQAHIGARGPRITALYEILDNISRVWDSHGRPLDAEGVADDGTG